jgi:hypothetical protein
MSKEKKSTTMSFNFDKFNKVEGKEVLAHNDKFYYLVPAEDENHNAFKKIVGVFDKQIIWMVNKFKM